MLAAILMTTLAAQPMDKFDVRAKDWRMGAVIYQVFVDRFVPPSDPKAQSKYYAPPRSLQPWSALPKGGTFSKEVRHYTHEMDFWGGDLKGVQSKLEYIKSFGADVLYLNPIFLSPTNHKYDTQDYAQIDPGYGTKADFLSLIHGVHIRGMKLVLDGVFNHMGADSKAFIEAQTHPNGTFGKWFQFGKQYANGYRSWIGVPNMPTLNLDAPAVQDFIWAGHDSIIKRYLRDGADGWRLDVAFDMGPKALAAITKAAHDEKKGSDVIGEISGYPSGWFPQVDGVFNFAWLRPVEEALAGRMSGGRAGTILRRMADDAGIENLLRSWTLIDNHDTPRARSIIPSWTDRRLAEALQFTLPGSPLVYYGSELGMEGGGDPTNRAPMRWDLVKDDNVELQWFRKLSRLHHRYPALRYGDFTVLDTDRLIAFSRTTSKVRDTVIVVVNPTKLGQIETFAIRVGRLMSWGQLRDQISGATLNSVNGFLTLDMAAKSVMILTPVTTQQGGYSPYDRIP